MGLDILTENPLGTAIGAGVIGIGAGLGAAAVIGSTSKKKTRSSRGRSRDRRFISKQKHEVRRRRKRPGKIYGKKGKYYSRKPLRKAGAKRRGGKKIYYTKNGQPYIKLKSGKARFIKRRSR